MSNIKVIMVKLFSRHKPQTKEAGDPGALQASSDNKWDETNQPNVAMSFDVFRSLKMQNGQDFLGP